VQEAQLDQQEELRAELPAFERAVNPENALRIRPLPHSSQEWLSWLSARSRNSVIRPQFLQTYSYRGMI